MKAEGKTTVLAYSLAPATTQANTRARLTLVATNGGQDLHLTPDDEIYVNLPVGAGANSLTPDLDSISTQAPANWRNSKAPAGGDYNFVISPLQNVRVAAGASLLFVFDAVIINAAQGTATVALAEFIGSGDAGKTFEITKSEATFSVIAQAIPSTVGLDQPTTLKWTSVKAGYVTIDPLEGQFDAVGQLETIPTADVPGEAQVVYTVTAWTPDQKFVRDTVVVTLARPTIDFQPRDHAPIGYDDEVELSWNIQYANQSLLTLPTGTKPVRPEARLKVQPKKMLLENQDVAVYRLRSTGWGPAVTATVNIPFKPVAINYFRYPAAGVTNSYQMSVANGIPQVDTCSGPQGSYFRLTATGPDGPLVQYLGAYPSLQIQLFLASADNVAPGTAVTLQWQTVLATSMTLSANGGEPQSITPGQLAVGNTVVKPAVTTRYVLTATDSGGAQVSSSLEVHVKQ